MVKNNFKKITKFLTKIVANLIVKVFVSTFFGRFFLDQILDLSKLEVKLVKHKGLSLLFSTPSSLCYYRASTFSDKEPETLEWIDAMSPGSTFWDIGANVGLYSCYAAKAKMCDVYSFEPSVFNLEILARNIFINNLTNKITIMPFPISDSLSINTLKMSSVDPGGALSTFGQNYGQDGKKLNDIFEFRTLGLSIDSSVELLKIPSPNYLKIDVDGIEALILQGAEATLKYVDSVLVEINEEFEEQVHSSFKYLSNSGFHLYKRFSLGSGQQYNQWWVRSMTKVI